MDLSKFKDGRVHFRNSGVKGLNVSYKIINTAFRWSCSKAVVPVLVLLFVALWFILRGDLFYALPCVILFLCFSVLLALRLPHLGKRANLMLFVRLFDLCLFGFVGFLFLLVSGRAAVCDCGIPWTFLLPFFSKCVLPIYELLSWLTRLKYLCQLILVCYLFW